MAKCTCREAKSHRDCAYCGYGGPCTHVCGQCKLGGIDGPVIRGTEQRRCAKHKVKEKPNVLHGMSRLIRETLEVQQYIKKHRLRNGTAYSFVDTVGKRLEGEA